MTVIVNSGSTIVVPASGLTLTADSTIAAGGVLETFTDGTISSSGGTITGGFNLINDGVISVASLVGLTIDTASFTNQGTILNEGPTYESPGSPFVIQSSVDLTNLVDGTLTGGTWTFVNGGLDLLDGTISTVNATLSEYGDFGIVEVGPGGIGTQSIVNTITEVGSSGVLTVNNNPAWATPGPLNVDGTFNFGGGVLSATGGVTVSATGTLNLSGELVSPLTLNGSLIANNLQVDSTISGSGTIGVNSGFLTFENPVTLTMAVALNAGLIVASDGTMTVAGAVSGTGASNIWRLFSSDLPQISNVGFFIQEATSVSSINALELDTATNFNVAFSSNAADDPFAPPGGDTSGYKFGELILDQPGGFGGFVDDFDNNDTIVLKGIAGNTATWNGNVLTVMNNATTVYTMGLLPLLTSYDTGSHQFFEVTNVSQDYSGAEFVATPDNIDNNTTITVSGIQDTVSSFFPQCFHAGTGIGTPDGPVAVERLSPGDLVTTHFGAARRVVWIGHREVDCRRHPDPRSVWPVRISPDAFAEDQPHSPLYLSPDHALFVDGFLIPVRHLINGTTIRQIAMDRVTYHHVELEEHDIVIAEGLAAESYLDCGNRGFFANGGAPIQLFPNFAARKWEMASCAPLVVTGPRLVRVRAMLEKRAYNGMFLDRTTAAPAGGK